ncbi:hypothetical protein V8E36_007002 [Tilletia maclaganii]
MVGRKAPGSSAASTAAMAMAMAMAAAVGKPVPGPSGPRPGGSGGGAATMNGGSATIEDNNNNVPLLSAKATTALTKAAQHNRNQTNHKRRFALIVGRLNRYRARVGRTDFMPAPWPLSIQDPDVQRQMAEEREGGKRRRRVRADGDGDDVSSSSDEDEEDDIPPSLPLVGEDVDRVREVTHQFNYHIDNFSRDQSYNLPPLLAPTELQRSRPHDGFLALLPIPEVRDALIRHEGCYDLDDLIFWFLDALRIHDGDLLHESTWEVDAPFFLRYPFAVTERMLNRTNHYRQERGQEVVPMAEIQRRLRKWEAKQTRRQQKKKKKTTTGPSAAAASTTTHSNGRRAKAG